MPEDFRHVHPNYQLKISAPTWNAILDSALAHRQGRLGNVGQGAARANHWGNLVEIKNNSGSNVDRFGVLGIDGPIITPSTNLDEFKLRIYLSGTTPSSSSHKGKFVVCRDAIPDGDTGKAWIAGVCPAYVNINSTSDETCDVKDSNASQLDSTNGGSAQILWKDSGTGPLWCLIRFGTAPIGRKIWGNLADPLGECDATVGGTITNANPPGLSGSVTLYNDGGFIGADGGWFVASEDSDGRFVIDNCQCTIPECP